MRSSMTMIVVTLFFLMLANVMAAGKTIWESEDPDASDMTTSPARSHEYSTSTNYAASVYTQTVSYSLDDFQRSLSKACGTNYALVEPIFKEPPTITTSLSVITIQTVYLISTTTSTTTTSVTTPAGTVVTSLPDVIYTQDRSADAQMKMMITYILHSLHSLLLELFEVKTSIAWISLLVVPSLLKLVDHFLTWLGKVMWHAYLRRTGQAPEGEGLQGDGANQQGNNAQDPALDRNAIELEDRAEAVRRDGDAAARPDEGGAVNVQDAAANN